MAWMPVGDRKPPSMDLPLSLIAGLMMLPVRFKSYPARRD
jgi:hypothetical protein